MWAAAIFVVTFVAYTQGQTANYCASTLCSGRKHIACDNTGAFSSTCRAGRKIVDITPFKTMILNKHNEYRNKIAGGTLPGFNPASRMGTMQWDDELVKLAELNVKQCVMKHDACRNTDRFKFSGQNLARRWERPAPTAEASITFGIESWFNEYKDAKQANIDRVQKSSAVIGHFTVMVVDRNIRVGCSLLNQPRDGGEEFFFACNYAQTNVSNRKIYVSGPATSKCTKGKNPQYPNLCATTEPIDPNINLV